MRKRNSVKRGGYVMVLFAMLLFGIMAMAALVIDIGFARLAQRQMQTAADAAAFEGLRGKGLPDFDYETRQANAEQFVTWHFDDDLDETNGDKGIAGQGGAFGAGPIVEFSGGAGDPSLSASQLMTIDPENAVYKPEMQRRVANDDGESEFQVVLQRGGIPCSDPHLYSTGQTVPFLFARGSLIDREFVRSGMVVRGSSAAVLEPVVCVGNANIALDIRGKLNVAVSLTEWRAGTGMTFFQYENNAIGGEVDSTLAGTPNGTEGYVAIYDDTPASPTVNRVIGFGPVSISGMMFSRIDGFVRPNASAVFCYPFASTGVDDDLIFESRTNNAIVLFKLPVSGTVIPCP